MSGNFNMNFDPVVKQQFAQLTKNYGLTVAQAFKLFANQSIKTDILPLSFDWQQTTANTELSTDNLNLRTRRAITQGRIDYHANKLDKLASYQAVPALQDLARG